MATIKPVRQSAADYFRRINATPASLGIEILRGTPPKKSADSPKTSLPHIAKRNAYYIAQYFDVPEIVPVLFLYNAPAAPNTYVGPPHPNHGR